ncbi:hypothetical protein CAL14_16635 [Bordetella genomosp. 9]|uniref:hypothetical protein n=1 Tax=Bordetella genomosp. 9 TaxID=1416803 RepID=UPI000A291CA7|nr:hypothetical protein [Bordetella genomosp. 9]ARP91714.1 hypothetical protein CAL14_16635 [Bordetella genomosp. 9]
MTRHLFTAAALLALAGCTTPDDMLKRDPVFFGHTSKPPQAYAQCVADAWRRQGEDVKMLPTKSGYDVIDAGATGMAAVLRVQQYASGKVEIRMSARASYGVQDQVQAANLCM